VVEQRDLVGVLIARALSMTRVPSVTWTPARWSASRATMSGMSTPSFSPSTSCSRISCAIRAPSASGTPVSTGMAPRIGVTPARKLSGGSHGAYIW